MALNGGAIAINNVLNTAYIANCTFSSNQATRNGGAIYVASSLNSDNSKTIKIANCNFSGCRSNSGGAMYIDSVMEVVLEGVNRFECCSATQFGSILALQIKTPFFNLPSTTIIENQTDGSQFLIYCFHRHFRCYNLNLTNNITQNCFYIYGENGYTELNSIHFESVAQAISISPLAENTEVLDCTFYNCYPSSTDSIVSISSFFDLLFSNNTFDSIKDGRPTTALYIQYYSRNCEISHNRFLNCDSYQRSRPAIRFAGEVPPLSYVSSWVFKFNYNYLKNVGSTKLGVFIFIFNNQQSDIEFCHNEMDECINLNANDNGYMCDIEMIPDTGFEFNNFTLRNCQSYATYGGSFGLWATSASSNPMISFFNCRFINNFRRSSFNDNGGGGFQLGTGSNSYFELVFTYCEFIGNSAYRGGGLSISTQRPLTIHNCVFFNNSCNSYGGAIYLKPNARNTATLMEKCTIYNCTFEQNYAIQNLSISSVIFIERNPNIRDTFIEIESCNFIDNANIYSTSGYIIHSEAPLFSITNSTIEYSNITERSIGFLSVYNGTNTIRDITIIRSAGMSNPSGLSVFLNTGTTSIFENCTFIECGNRIDSFTIQDNSDNCVINNCNFTYHPTNDSMKSSVINITSCTVHSITNTFLSYAKCETSGIIRFFNPSHESLTLENLTMEHLNGYNNDAFNFVFNPNSPTSMNNILIRNCECSACLFSFALSEAGSFTFSKFQFVNNSFDLCSFGLLFLMAPTSDSSPNTYVDFIDCLFEQNSCDSLLPENFKGMGGGIVIGGHYQSKKVFYSVINCTFISNYASISGGGLVVATNNECLIENCNFTSNNSSQGGAISIQEEKVHMLPGTVSPKITISSCIFHSNASPKGSAIYFSGLQGFPETILHITNHCVFSTNIDYTNIATSSAIVGLNKNVEINNIEFNFSDHFQSERAIYVSGSTTLNVHNCTFTFCNAKGSGNAILLENGQFMHIRDCEFEDNGINGWTIYSSCPHLLYENNRMISKALKSSGSIGLFSSGNIIIRNSVFDNIHSHFGNEYGFNNIGNCITIYHPHQDSIDEEYEIYNLRFLSSRGDMVRCINASTYYPISLFNNVSIENSPNESSLLCLFVINANNAPSFNLTNCKFIRNSVDSCSASTNAESIGGGSGIAFSSPNDNGSSIHIINCLFEENQNSRNGGGLQCGYKLPFARMKIIVESCTFNNNLALEKGGGIAIHTVNEWKILDCVFNHNQAKHGGALYIGTEIEHGDYYTDRISLILDRNQFVNNTADSHQGTFLYIDGITSNSENDNYDFVPIEIKADNVFTNSDEQGSQIYNKWRNLILTDITFSYSVVSTAKNFRPLETAEKGTTIINNCNFINTGFTTLQEENGFAIFINGGTVIINQCNFTNCQPSNDKYIIYKKGEKNESLTISNSVFLFDNRALSSGAIYIDKWNCIDISNTNFTNCWTKPTESKFSGALTYGIGNYNHLEENNCNFNLYNCIFRNCDREMNSQEGSRVLFGYFGCNCQIVTCRFEGSTVGSGPLLFLDYNNVNSSTFDNLTFINNEAAIGGGSGIVITGITNEILFTNCQFIDNELIGESGGAICFNYEDPNIAPLIITFRQSLFKNNHARNKNGGAISINSIKTSLNVDRCSFNSSSIKNDEIPYNGGAIYIEKAIKVFINECHFINLNSNNGCAIYYKKTENVKNRLIVRKSQFIDCESAETGKKLIFADSVKVILEDIDITYSDEDTV